MRLDSCKRMAGTLLLVGLYASLTPQLARAGTEPFLGQISWVAFNFAPQGWAPCQGQLLPINQNVPLFSLLGTTFGGDGVTTFALPDLRGRAPIHVSPQYGLGEQGGAETHTLSGNELPPHVHTFNVDPREATSAEPGPLLYPAKTSQGTSAYGSTANSSMPAAAIGTQGGGQPHENMKPFIAMTCIIALQGIYPVRD